MRLFVSQAVLLIALRVAGLAVFQRMLKFIFSCSVARRVPQLASLTLKICGGGDSPEKWNIAPYYGESRNWLL